MMMSRAWHTYTDNTLSLFSLRPPPLPPSTTNTHTWRRAGDGTGRGRRSAACPICPSQTHTPRPPPPACEEERIARRGRRTTTNAAFPAQLSLKAYIVTKHTITQSAPVAPANRQHRKHGNMHLAPTTYKQGRPARQPQRAYTQGNAHAHSPTTPSPSRAQGQACHETAPTHFHLTLARVRWRWRAQTKGACVTPADASGGAAPRAEAGAEARREPRGWKERCRTTPQPQFTHLCFV